MAGVRADSRPVLDRGGVPRRCVDLYDDDGRFRSTIDMARHRFGEGQYRYFAVSAARGRPAAARRVLAPPAPDRPGVGRAAPVTMRRGPTSFDDWLDGATTPGRPGRRR